MTVTIGPDSPKTRNRKGAVRQAAMLGALIFFTLFLLNILIGKASFVFTFDAAFLVGVVLEFLWLLMAVILFVIAALASEQIRDEASGGPTNQGRNT